MAHGEVVGKIQHEAPNRCLRCLTSSRPARFFQDRWRPLRYQRSTMLIDEVNESNCSGRSADCVCSGSNLHASGEVSGPTDFAFATRQPIVGSASPGRAGPKNITATAAQLQLPMARPTLSVAGVVRTRLTSLRRGLASTPLMYSTTSGPLRNNVKTLRPDKAPTTHGYHGRAANSLRSSHHALLLVNTLLAGGLPLMSSDGDSRTCTC